MVLKSLNKFLSVVLWLIFLAFSGCDDSDGDFGSPSSDDVPDSVEITSSKTRAIEYSILRYTNQERADHNKSLLKWDSALSAIARQHSRDMVERDFYDHDNPDGQGPTERADEAGYEGGFGIAENIARMPIGPVQGHGTVENKPDSVAKELLKSWMNSAGHRANILNASYDVLGIGVAFDGEEYYATQNFH